MSEVRERRIVVGIDGSGEATAALCWAAKQARLVGAVVEAVTVDATEDPQAEAAW